MTLDITLQQKRIDLQVNESNRAELETLYREIHDLALKHQDMFVEIVTKDSSITPRLKEARKYAIAMLEAGKPLAAGDERLLIASIMLVYSHVMVHLGIKSGKSINEIRDEALDHLDEILDKQKGN